MNARTPQRIGRSRPVTTAVRKKNRPVKALMTALRSRYLEIWRVIRSNITAIFIPLLFGTAASSFGMKLCRSKSKNRKKMYTNVATLVMSRNLFDMDVRLLMARLDQLTGSKERKLVPKGRSTNSETRLEMSLSSETTFSA